MRAAFAVPCLAVASIALAASFAAAGCQDEPRPTPITAISVTAAATATATPTSSPTVSPTPTLPGGYPSTKMPVTDAVLREVSEGNAAALMERVRFTSESCAEKPMGIGSPPMCPAGATEGTPVEVFPFDVCEANWETTPAAVADRLATALAAHPQPVAIEKPAAPMFGQSTPPDYLVHFFYGERRRGVFKVSLHADGTITGIDYCPDTSGPQPLSASAYGEALGVLRGYFSTWASEGLVAAGRFTVPGHRAASDDLMLSSWNIIGTDVVSVVSPDFFVLQLTLDLHFPGADGGSFGEGRNTEFASFSRTGPGQPLLISFSSSPPF